MPILQMVMAIAKYKACIFVATMVVLRVMDAEVACYIGLLHSREHAISFPPIVSWIKYLEVL